MASPLLFYCGSTSANVKPAEMVSTLLNEISINWKAFRSKTEGRHYGNRFSEFPLDLQAPGTPSILLFRKWKLNYNTYLSTV